MSTTIKENLIQDQPIPVNLKGAKEILFQMENCICKIVNDRGGKGTGFFCKIPFPDKNKLLYTLITNNHILNGNDIKNSKIIKIIMYNKDQNIEKKIRIDTSRKKYTIYNEKKGIDITIIEIKPNKDKINNFLEIDDKILELECIRKSIYILHYPQEERLVSFGLMNDIFEGNKINHYCNTEKGSSGGPILSLNNNKVIGVHYGGYIDGNMKINFGTFIKYAIKEFYNKYKSDELAANEIIIKYQIGKENKIRIFGEYFVENNKSNFQMKINDKNYNIGSFYNIKNEKENEILKIKLKQIKNSTNLSGMFEECFALIELFDISKLDTNKVTDMSFMFNQCRKLSSLPDISKWNTNDVKYMNSMFQACSSLTELPDISKWNTDKVTDMSFMFTACNKLSSLPDISKWNTNNVNNMKAVFSKCIMLSSLPDISKWNTDNVNNMSTIFQLCSSLTELPDISKWNTNKVTDMSYIFSKCSKLSSLPDISKWNTNNVINMNAMFNECSILLSLPDISKWNTNNLNNISAMFNKCNKLSSLPNISKWNTNNVVNMLAIFNEYSKLLSLPDISKWNTNNLNNMSAMFQLCSSLIQIPDISKWNTNKVTDMSNMFYGCSKLSSLPDISKWNLNNVTNHEKIFEGCLNLSKLPNIFK